MTPNHPQILHPALPDHATVLGGDRINDFGLLEQQITPIERSSHPHVSRRDYHIAFCRHGGTCSESKLRSIAHIKDPDVATCAGYYFDRNSKLNIILSERFSWGVGGNLTILPRRYLHETSRSSDLGAAVHNVLKRIGVVLKSDPRLLSGPAVPLPGLLTTIEVPFAVNVDPSSFAPRIVFDNYYGPILYRGVRSKEIIGNVLRRNFHDLHALYAALKVEALHGIRSPIPNDIVQRLHEGTLQRVKSTMISSADQLDGLLWDQLPPGLPDSYQCKPSIRHESNYFTIAHEELQRRYSGYQEVHKVTGNIVRLKDGLKTQVIVMGYVRGKDDSGVEDVHLLVNLGNRPLIAREFERHPIQTEEAERSIEPWIFYSTGTPSLAEISDNFTQLSGIKTRGTPIPLGSFYQSPEFVDLKTEIYLVELDASTFRPSPNVPDLWQTLVPLSEVRKGAEEGVITSLPLAAVAEIVGRGFGYSFKNEGPFRLPEEIDRFNQRIRAGSEYRALLESNFSRQFDSLSHSEMFYRLLEHVFNEGFGLKADGTDFFSCVPEYGLLADLPPLQRFVLLIHDLWHGEQGEFIPWDFSVHPPKMSPKDVFKRLFLSNEAGSVYFSEVALAKRYGFERWRTESGQFSLGEVFDICGIRDKGEARKAVLSIVRDGTIPDTIRLHERFNEIKDTVIDFLGYHFRDNRNGDVAYEFWASHPLTAKAILDFNPRCTNSPSKHLRNIYKTEDRIRTFEHRGINPFKRDIKRLATTDLLKTAIRVGYLLDTCENDQVKTRFSDLYQELESLRNTTITAAVKVRGIHLSSRNVGSVRKAELIAERIREINAELEHTVLSLNLPAPEQDRILNRIPLWQATFTLTPGDNSNLAERVKRELSRGFGAAGTVDSTPFSA